MDIIINIEPIFDFLALPPLEMVWQLFLNFGWIIGIIFLWGAKEAWVRYRQIKWGGTIKYIFLAIDIPRGNAQSPKAVENIFSYLAGAHGTINLVEKYWQGKFQVSFSLEIVSIDGYTQFVIRTAEPFKNLVESAIYSQYPDAEITEVDDYTKDTPAKFPNDDYDIWGSEFILKLNNTFPIKTYEEFEHQFGEPEELFRDPMAALMDLCSSLKKGEQLWYQIILTPIDMFKWTKAGDKEVNKILGEKEKPGILENIISFTSDVVSAFIDFFTGPDEPVKKEEKKDDLLKMMNLTPRQKKQVEGIHNKTSKIGFEVKIRFLYLAKKEVMNKPKVSSGFVGYMKQFAAIDMNNLKPDMDKTATSVSYFFKDYRLNDRKTKIINNYKKRDRMAGRLPNVLNTEELATIWHFPIEYVVKAPLIQKAMGRKSEPPFGLPTLEEIPSAEISNPSFDLDILGEEKKNENGEKLLNKIQEKGQPPANLPFA